MPSYRELWAEAESSAAVVIVVRDLGWTESTIALVACNFKTSILDLVGIIKWIWAVDTSQRI